MWALGIILYSFVTGTFPFKAGSEDELFSKIKRGIFQMPDSIPYEIRKVLAKLISVDGNKRPTANELYYDTWLHGDKGCARKSTLKMINDQFMNNPLAQVVQDSGRRDKTLVPQKRDWKSNTRSATESKRVDPEKHLKAIDRIRSLGYEYTHINEKLRDVSSDISQIYRAFIK